LNARENSLTSRVVISGGSGYYKTRNSVIYMSLNIAMAFKSLRLQWLGHVAQTGR